MVTYCLHNHTLKKLTEAGQSGSWTFSQVTRFLYSSMTRKPGSDLQSGCSRVRVSPMKFKGPRSTSKQMIAVFSAKSGLVASAPLQERERANAEWYLNTCLAKAFQSWSARSHPPPPKKKKKYRHPRPAAPPRQRKCPHRRRHSGIPGDKSRSAGHPDHVFSGLSTW